MRIIFSFLIFTAFFITFQKPATNQIPQHGFDVHAFSERLWVDSVYQSLSPDERIAQLIMVRSFSNMGRRYTDSIADVLKRYNLGGVIFFKGTPTSQAVMTNRFQHSVKTPLLIAMDAEWGHGMRLDSTISFPRQLALGAIEDDLLIYEMGIEIGRQLRRLGVHINFAPVVDVNNNANNPVINSRSFGENIFFVAHKSAAYMLGMQNMGVISVAKHFPGHGDTDKDSHYTLPLISKSFHEIDSIHLFPFKYLIQKGLNGVMTAHLAIPAIDSHPKAISSLSKKAVDSLLRRNLGFEGLIFTDGLEMKAIADYVHPDSVEIKALLAGNDILLLPVNTPRAIRNISNAVKKGILPESLIEERCRRVLTWKYRAGLADGTPVVKLEGLMNDLNPPAANLLHRRLVEASLTMLNNENELFPLMRPDTLKMAIVEMGTRRNTVFTERMKYYSKFDSHWISKSATAKQYDDLVKTLSAHDLVIVCLRGTNQTPAGNYGITKETVAFLYSLAEKTQVALVLAANPYSLALFPPHPNLKAILLAYQDTDMSADLSAQALLGAVKVTGELPVTASPNYTAGSGNQLVLLPRFKYTLPEEAGISSQFLKKIDSIALRGISEKAFPGCRIIAVKDGMVFYDKSFGHHTYNLQREVSAHDVYDVASITKITTTMAIMYLYQHGLIDIDQRISYYLPELSETNKKNLIIRDILAHQARLQAWIPFFSQATKNGKLDPQVFRNEKNEKFSIEVARNLFMNEDYISKIYDTIAASPLINRQRYLYSDLGFYWLQQMVERIAGLPLDEFIDVNFSKPLSLNSTAYNAHRHFDLTRVVPTENDSLFRKQLIHGYVHDPGAAMLGGVGGHAGLFATANDVAIIMHMLMNNGNYSGRQYFAPHVLSEFTRTQFPLNDNRRGLGFDKPQLKREKDGPTSLSVSNASFGHSGFTGTYAWADPEHGLVYVFLSNRIHPTTNNNKLSRLSIRTAIHSAFYEAIQKSRAEETLLLSR